MNVLKFSYNEKENMHAGLLKKLFILTLHIEKEFFRKTIEVFFDSIIAKLSILFALLSFFSRELQWETLPKITFTFVV